MLYYWCKWEENAVLGTYQNSAGERARKYKVTPMSTLFNVTLLSETKTSAPDRRQTCTTSSSFHSDKTMSSEHPCSQGSSCETKIIPESEQCPKTKQINTKTATKTVRNSLPPTLLLTHGDQQEQNECHQVEDLGKKKAGKEKKITKEFFMRQATNEKKGGKYLFQSRFCKFVNST